MIASSDALFAPEAAPIACDLPFAPAWMSDDPTRDFTRGLPRSGVYWGDPLGVSPDIAGRVDPVGSTLAVLETGVSAADLQRPGWDWLLGRDWVDGDLDPVTNDGTAVHGSQVLGAIASGMATTGWDPAAGDRQSIWFSRAVGSGQWEAALQDFLATPEAAGATVNLSFDLATRDGTGGVTPRTGLTETERAVLRQAQDLDVLITVAVGRGDRPSILADAAAAFDNVLVVGAVDPGAAGDRAANSSPSPELDVVIDGRSEDGASGTSFAAARAAGIAAQVRTANPDLSATDTIALLRTASEDVGVPGWDPDTGTGNLDGLVAIDLAPTWTPTALPETLPTAAANSVTSSSDAIAEGMTGNTVELPLSDPGLVITETNGSTSVVEGQTGDTYSVQLASQPVGNVAVTLTAADGLQVVANNFPNDAIAILPLGDSNTRGFPNQSGNGGYRTKLGRDLSNIGWDVDFLGRLASGPSDIDRDHEGWGGWTIDELIDGSGPVFQQPPGVDPPSYGTLETALASDPDVILLMAGTNDINQDDTPTNMLSELNTLLDRIETANPDVFTIVASPIPNLSTGDRQTRTAEFASRILPEVVQPRAGAGGKVGFADIFNTPDLQLSDFQTDGFHLNPTGYDKIADVWFDALSTWGSAFGAITDTLVFDPTNWNQPRNVGVGAPDDVVAQGDRTLSITHTFSGDDPGYNALAPVTLNTTVIDDESQKSALFVVGSPTLNSGDAAVLSHLQSLGYSVTVEDDNVVQSSDATGQDVVLISSTVISGAVGTKFTNTAVPVVTWEPYLFDDFGFVSGNNFGFTSADTSIDITNPSHPLAAGLSGLTSVYDQAGRLSWGTVGAGAEVIATLNGNATRSPLFAYDTGSTLVSGSGAADRRVGFFLFDTEATTLTPAGKTLLNSALDWAIA